MPRYDITFGTYVRMYAHHSIVADDNEAARKLAIKEFQAKSHEMEWNDPQYDNLALPSIVTMQTDDDPPVDVLEGYDFPATPDDARQYAAHKMLAALELSA